jgi:hypothetical protein
MNFKKLLAVAAVLGVSVPAFGTLQIALQNTDLETVTYTITSASGSILPAGSGTIGIGVFNNLSDSDITSAFNTNAIASLSESFIGHAGTAKIDADFPGLFFGVYNAAIDASSPLAGKNVYVVINTGSSLFGAGQMLVYKANTLFEVDTGPTPRTVNVLMSNTGGTLLVGGFGNFSVDGGLGSAQPAFNTVDPIPEPSAIALLGLGALAGVFVIRRRR